MAPTLRTRTPKAPPTAATKPTATEKKTEAVKQAAKAAATKAKTTKADTTSKPKPTPAKTKAAKADNDKPSAPAKKPTTTKPTTKKVAPPKKGANTEVKAAAAKKKSSSNTTKAAAKVTSTTGSTKKKNGKAMATKAAPPSASLDRYAYPHIFDAIVGCAPYESLLRLRATSSEMREHADALLGHHIVLRAGLPPPKGARWLKTGLPRGPDRARPRGSRVNAAALGGQLPGWVCDFNHMNNNYTDTCGDDCTKLREYWENVFAQDTKILDWQPWGDQGYVMQRPAKAFPNLEVIRCYPRGSGSQRCFFQAPKLVTFVDFWEPDPKTYAEVGYTRSLFLDRDEMAAVQDIVTTVEYNTDRPSLPNCWVTFPCLGHFKFTTSTVIFLPEEDSPDAVNPEWDSPHWRPNGLLWDVVNSIRVKGTVDIILVGATEMPPQLIGIHDGIERTHEELQEQVLLNIIEWIRDDPQEITPEREQEIRSKITWYRRDEYREMVGPQQWRIETERTYNWDA